MKSPSRLFPWQPLLDFVYPPVCLACSSKLQNDESGVCNLCWQRVQTSSGFAELQTQLGAKFDNNGPISRAKSCFFFEEGGVLQKIIHALKYEGMRSLGIQLGKHLGEAVLVDDWLRFADVLIPVPLHKTKQRERGYNQSDYLCRGVCQKTSLPYRNDMLRRWKYT